MELWSPEGRGVPEVPPVWELVKAFDRSSFEEIEDPHSKPPKAKDSQSSILEGDFLRDQGWLPPSPGREGGFLEDQGWRSPHLDSRDFFQRNLWVGGQNKVEDAARVEELPIQLRLRKSQTQPPIQSLECRTHRRTHPTS